jgi:hypothetical protein
MPHALFPVLFQITSAEFDHKGREKKCLDPVTISVDPVLNVRLFDAWKNVSYLFVGRGSLCYQSN